MIIIIIFRYGLGRLISSGSDTLSSFPGASTVSSLFRFVVQGVFRKSGVSILSKWCDKIIWQEMLVAEFTVTTRDLAKGNEKTHWNQSRLQIPGKDLNPWLFNFEVGVLFQLPAKSELLVFSSLSTHKKMETKEERMNK